MKTNGNMNNMNNNVAVPITPNNKNQKQHLLLHTRMGKETI